MESEESKQKGESIERKEPFNRSVIPDSTPLQPYEEEQDLEQESIESIKEYADKVEQEARIISNSNLKKKKSKLWRLFKILIFIAVVYYIWAFIKNFQQRDTFYSFIHDIPFIGKSFGGKDSKIVTSSSLKQTTGATVSKEQNSAIDQEVQNLSVQKPVIIQNSFADLVGNANQSVVSIATRGYVSSDKSLTKDGNIDSLYAFFIDSYRNKKYRGLGSGFVVSQDGYIVTNYHVVRDVESITVHFLNGSFYKTKLDSYDEISDIALLKAEGAVNLPALRFGDSNRVRAGDWILAVGSPFGLGFSVSFGVISAKDRFISRSFVKFLQTDAAINRGNSGGPMINMLGEVIGINTSMASNNGGSVGVGFAIPSNQASSIISQLKENGRVLRGWLGVKVTEIGKQDSIVDEITKKGVLVYQVLSGSPAAKIGLKRGDIIYRLNDIEVSNVADFASILMSSNISDSMNIYYISGTKRMTKSVVLGEKQKGKKNSESESLAKEKRAEDNMGNGQSDTNKPEIKDIRIKESDYIKKQQQKNAVITTPIKGKHFEGMGIEFAELEGNYIKDFGFREESEGVVIISVVEKENLNRNLRPGLLLRKVNNMPVSNIDSLRKVVSSMKKEEDVIFLLEDNKGNKFFVSKQNKKYI